MVFERIAFNRVHRTRTGEHGSPLQFFTFNFQLARGQSHCRDCPLAFGDILILKLLIFLKCDFNLTVAR